MNDTKCILGREVAVGMFVLEPGYGVCEVVSVYPISVGIQSNKLAFTLKRSNSKLLRYSAFKTDTFCVLEKAE